MTQKLLQCLFILTNDLLALGITPVGSVMVEIGFKRFLTACKRHQLKDTKKTKLGVVNRSEYGSVTSVKAI